MATDSATENEDGWGICVGMEMATGVNRLAKVNRGSLSWTHTEIDYQIMGTFWVEQKRSSKYFRILFEGNEVDGGEVLKGTIYLPVGVTWKEKTSKLVSANAEGIGTGFILKFDSPNYCGLSRVQVVVPSTTKALVAALAMAHLRQHED